jgi:hypothetical protein
VNPAKIAAKDRLSEQWKGRGGQETKEERRRKRRENREIFLIAAKHNLSTLSDLHLLFRVTEEMKIEKWRER